MSDVVKKIDVQNNSLIINREKYKDHCFKSLRRRMNDMELYVDDPYSLLRDL